MIDPKFTILVDTGFWKRLLFTSLGTQVPVFSPDWVPGVKMIHKQEFQIEFRNGNNFSQKLQLQLSKKAISKNLCEENFAKEVQGSISVKINFEVQFVELIISSGRDNVFAFMVKNADCIRGARELVCVRACLSTWESEWVWVNVWEIKKEREREREIDWLQRVWKDRKSQKAKRLEFFLDCLCISSYVSECACVGMCAWACVGVCKYSCSCVSEWVVELVCEYVCVYEWVCECVCMCERNRKTFIF